MRILINGLPLFAQRLRDNLQEADPSSRFVFCDTYSSKWQQIKFLLLLPFYDAVISMNGVTDNSGSMNAVLKYRKKLILQWMGTDALLGMERFASGTIKRDYIDYASNFVDSSWLMDEVSSLGVHPEMMPIKFIEPKNPVDRYEGISGMTYIAQGRQAFYGIHEFCAIAEANPSIPFKLFGVTDPVIKLPENIEVMGWVEPATFQETLRSTPIFIRLAEHEGFPVSVVEATGYGCEIIMRMPFDKALQATNSQEAVQAFERAKANVEQRNLIPNVELIDWARQNFNKQRMMASYIEKLKQLIDA